MDPTQEDGRAGGRERGDERLTFLFTSFATEPDKLEAIDQVRGGAVPAGGGAGRWPSSLVDARSRLMSGGAERGELLEGVVGDDEGAEPSGEVFGPPQLVAVAVAVAVVLVLLVGTFPCRKPFLVTSHVGGEQERTTDRASTTSRRSSEADSSVLGSRAKFDTNNFPSFLYHLAPW
ncbi:hypothetical protein T439DRAFT_331243 [Meredithblackwellia eburnea MCA 4105]